MHVKGASIEALLVLGSQTSRRMGGKGKGVSRPAKDGCSRHAVFGI